MRINRRRMISLATSATATAGSALAAGASATHSVAAQAQAASAGCLRRWAIVIDLRKCDGCQSTGKQGEAG